MRDSCPVGWRYIACAGKTDDGVACSFGCCGRGVVIHRIKADGEHPSFDMLSAVRATMASARVQLSQI